MSFYHQGKFEQGKGLESLGFNFTALEINTFAAQEWGTLTYPKQSLAQERVLRNTYAFLVCASVP